MYHRVADLPDYSYPIVVSPDHFAQQMEYIRRTCEPMRLLDLVDGIKRNRLPRRGVVVTFDDGYVDNFIHAYPILEEAQIPATVCVTSGYIDSPKEFWWDELERLLLSPAHERDRLQISVRGRLYQWPTASLDQRASARRSLHQILKPLPTKETEGILAEIGRWAGSGGTARPHFRPMTAVELVRLHRSGIIDLGAHTMTHPLLPTLSPEDQRKEIAGSAERLKALVGGPMLTFAYPYGGHSADTVEILKSCGFVAACTTEQGCVGAGADLLRLPRNSVGDWNRETFQQQLEGFFLGDLR